MIGIVVAMMSEARIFGVRRIVPFEPVKLSSQASLVLCGMGPENAQRAAEQLWRAGVTGLVSFGVAGALDPGLRSGDLLCPERVVDDRGGAYGIDEAWRNSMADRLARRQEMLGGTLLSSTTPLSSASDKAAARMRHAAIAVDMESAAIGAVAQAARLPFLVLRAVADELDTRLPAAVLDAVDVYGRPRPGALLVGLARNPGAVLDLPTLGRAFGKARTSLSTALRLASHDLAWPSASSAGMERGGPAAELAPAERGR